MTRLILSPLFFATLLFIFSPTASQAGDATSKVAGMTCQSNFSGHMSGEMTFTFNADGTTVKMDMVPGPGRTIGPMNVKETGAELSFTTSAAITFPGTT